MCWGLAVISVAGVAALSRATWLSDQTSKREAAIFAGLSASAFEQRYCDRALRLVIAGLPPSEGAFPTTFRSRQLQGALAYFASASECKFRAALIGHAGLVDSAVFSPDGSRVVTASWDGTARLWNAKTGTPLTTLSGHTTWLNSAQFSPDGGRIVTASADKTARVWNADTGIVLAKLLGHEGSVNSAAFSPDGSRIVTASGDNTARVWNAATGELLTTLSGHTDAVTSAAFSPDGSRVVTASFDNTARVWDS